MANNNLKNFLDEFAAKYETQDFIANDPIQFPHRFEEKKDIELSGFIASSLAYGKREKIIESVEKIHLIMQNEPYNFILAFEYARDYKLFNDFTHRFTRGEDIALLFGALNSILQKYNSLENLFMAHYNETDETIKQALSGFVEKLTDEIPACQNPSGCHYLMPSPVKNSACKRLNMFLRWMVREKPVDFGIWHGVGKDKLIIPLDAHVSRISRILKLTGRKSNDWKTAEEITNALKFFDANDPVKYDFAIFGAGVNKTEKELVSLFK